jgi:Predicted redox protein, regulator of disulfide bond formation
MVDLLDVTGKSCPIPVLETRKALQKMKSGQELLVVVDYPLSKDNIMRLVDKEHNKILNVKEEDCKFFINILKG